jgi:hypothetical protein
MDLGIGDRRIGIVGSRRRTDREAVEACSRNSRREPSSLPGARKDQWAEEAVWARGLPVAVHKPELDGALTRWQAADRHYASNQRIVDDSDLIVAFVAPDRTGDTEDTIHRANRAGKPVVVR